MVCANLERSAGETPVSVLALAATQPAPAPEALNQALVSVQTGVTKVNSRQPGGPDARAVPDRAHTAFSRTGMTSNYALLADPWRSRIPSS
jgi:hypothetical protein